MTFLETGEFCVNSSQMTDDWCSLLNARAIVKSERVTWAVYGAAEKSVQDLGAETCRKGTAWKI